MSDKKNIKREITTDFRDPKIGFYKKILGNKRYLLLRTKSVVNCRKNWPKNCMSKNYGANIFIGPNNCGSIIRIDLQFVAVCNACC